MIFAAAFKVYSTVSCRRFCSDLRAAHAKGYLSKAPSYNTVLDYFGYEAMTPYLRQLIEVSAMPLRGIESTFAADSSGFCSGVAGQWMKAKYYKRDEAKMITWLKVHLMCGTTTNIITAVEVTGKWESDYKYLAPLFEPTSRNFDMKEVVADKGRRAVAK